MVTAITSKSTFAIVVGESLQSKSNLLAQIWAVSKLDSNVKIGLFLTTALSSMNIPDRLDRWMGKSEVINIFCAFYFKNNYTSDETFNVIRFNPFEKFDVIDVTRNDSIANIFHAKLLNYHKRRFRIIKTQDGSFLYWDYQFWDTFTDVINASLGVVAYGQRVGPASLILGDAIATSINLKESKTKIYPHKMSRLIMSVPHAKAYTSFVEFLKNGTWKRLFAYFIIVIAASTIILTTSRYLQDKKLLLFQSVIDVINLLMNDDSAVRYQRLQRADVCVVVPLAFTGIIIANGVLSLFQSFLTVPTYEHQINTLDELYNSSVSIIIGEISWARGTLDALNSLTNYSGWMDKIHDKLRSQEKMTICNNSMAATLIEESARAYVQSQDQLNMKLVHLIKDVTLEQFLQVYIFRPDYPFTEHVNKLIHRLQAAGLIEYWREVKFEGFMRIYLEDWKTCVVDIREDEFGIPAIVWWGWVASLLIFICEIIWKKIASKNMGICLKFCCKKLR